jgi:hypothetical protein
MRLSMENGREHRSFQQGAEDHTGSRSLVNSIELDKSKLA